MEKKKEDNEGTYLVWEDITVVAPNKVNRKNSSSTRKVLSELSGFAQRNRIMALMGPSGSGKSTLLDAFAGRLSSNVKMTGSVTVKGKKSSENNCGGISYLTQEDVFLGTLSVRETMAYSAKLRVSAKRSREEIEEVVEKTIAEMGLEQCADQKIGNWHFRGISGGERKRLSIGLEILTQPLVMLLDEPTTGLDSASAFFVVWALRNIALHGRIVVCSIHQPSGYLFDLFHDLCLLSAGESVYFGEANLAVKFFEEAGFPCRERTNPTDHFLRCVNTDFDNVADTLLRSKSLLSKPQSSGSLITTTASKENLTTQNIKAILIEKYKSSEYATRAMEKIRQINSDGEVIRLSNKSKAGWWKQLYTMTDRSFVNMTRDVGYYWLRILFYVSIGVSIGTMYYKIDRSFLAIINRAKCQAFVYGFMICLSCGGLPSFMEELKVYARELKNKHYEESIVVIANFLSSFPFLVVMSFTSGTVIYEMVKFRPGFSHYAYFCLNLFGCISVVESTIMLVAYLVPNVLMGIGLGTGLIVFMMLASEIARPLNDLPKFFWRYPMSYISFASWAMQGVYKNDMIGVEFEPLTPGDPKVKGETALQFMFGVPIERSKWWDLTVLLALVLFHRIIFFLVIKFKSRLSICITLRANKGFHSIAQTYSSLKKHFSSSKKRQPIHSLSSQLSLSSPIRP